MKNFLSSLLIIVIVLSPAPVCSQTAAQDQDEVIRVRSNEVQLDVVIKDKKGRPIRDLKATEFEVFEDGVRQKVESLRFVSRETVPVTSEKKDDTSTGATSVTDGTPAKR